MSIKVLHIIDHYKIGGPGKTILNSARFISHRFAVHLCVFQTGGSGDDTEILAAARKRHIPTVALDDAKGLSFSSIQKLKHYIAVNDIRIVHAHGYKTNLIAVILKIMGTRAKIVTTFHGWIVNSLKQGGYRRLDQTLSLFFDGIVCVNQIIFNSLPPMSRNRKTTRIIHNAIVLEDYQPIHGKVKLRRALGLDDRSIGVGIVGRLSREKGCVEALDMFDRLGKTDPRFKGIYIGEGPLYGELDRRIERRDLRHGVRLLGYKNPVQPYIAALDLLLCPSFTEGISNVLLEAMAMKVPVVATRVGGNPEIITDQSNGLLVDPGQPGQWHDTIVALFDHPSKIAQLTSNGYATIEKKFSFQSRMKKIEKLYDRVLDHG